MHWWLVVLVVIVSDKIFVITRYVSNHSNLDRTTTIKNIDNFGAESVGVVVNPFGKHHPGHNNIYYGVPSDNIKSSGGTVIELRHVCTHHKNVSHPVRTKQTFCKPTFKQYVVRCNGNQFCTGVRLVYEKHYKDVITTRNSNEVTYSCCPGWAQINSRSHGCNKPLCTKTCLNGGKCIKPDHCQCPEGFKGKQCEITMSNICMSNCLNGGVCYEGQCQCNNGFKGLQCELDLDECKEHKPCDQICYNTHGSYSCECRENFILQNDGHSCRKEDDNRSDGDLEVKDMEFEMFDKRLLKLETMMDENHKNEVTKDDVKEIYVDINHIMTDVKDLKINLMDIYKNDIILFKQKLNQIEKKTEKVDDLFIRYERMKKCAFFNKICL